MYGGRGEKSRFCPGAGLFEVNLFVGYEFEARDVFEVFGVEGGEGGIGGYGSLSDDGVQSINVEIGAQFPGGNRNIGSE